MASATDPRVQKFGFAVLEGSGIEHYIQKYETYLGRASSKNSQVDVVLGDNMNISRKHAIIAYNFEDRVFELRAAGKNGVIVTPAGGEGQTILPTDPAPLPLRNADEIHIGDFKFKFWLAKDPARHFEGRRSMQGGGGAQLAAEPPFVASNPMATVHPTAAQPLLYSQPPAHPPASIAHQILLAQQQQQQQQEAAQWQAMQLHAHQLAQQQQAQGAHQVQQPQQVPQQVQQQHQVQQAQQAQLLALAQQAQQQAQQQAATQHAAPPNTSDMMQ